MAMKYEAVADSLRKKIRTGAYRPGDQLPSIEHLCELYSVSKITVKKALDELESSGLISRRRGSGSFVKNIKPLLGGRIGHFETSGQMAGFMNEHKSLGQTVQSVVKEFAVVTPPPEIASMLSIDEDQFCYHIVRIRIADDEPRTVEYTYMPINIIPGLRVKTLEDSIYNYIENDLGLKVASGHRIVRAVLPTKDETEWLNISRDSPMLEVEQVGYLDDGTAFEYSISRHPNGYEFRTISIN
ncbi:GntR family transcriptional regulator [Paratractidigestivibacter sp.]|uniref:GntR family transcriptional regulator n=1 Tax=Paratractidigestivibacter sp. TaxID=2847316 RepID=UPI002ABDD494|nr:GntR family transcriptional regulator [Paratractidigestivibacter sp.]